MKILWEIRFIEHKLRLISTGKGLVLYKFRRGEWRAIKHYSNIEPCLNDMPNSLVVTSENIRTLADIKQILKDYQEIILPAILQKVKEQLHT